MQGTNDPRQFDSGNAPTLWRRHAPRRPISARSNCRRASWVTGVIVVDTGESARVSEPGYFPRWQPFFRFAVRMDVKPKQEIGPQLQALGITPRDVRTVVLTHLHTDHAGGLSHFPGVEILVTRKELEYARGLAGRVRGYPSNRWPDWFEPTLIDLPGSEPPPRRRQLVHRGGDARWTGRRSRPG